jgi:tetratricopeptide (TPR) repeat protein
MTDPWHLEKLQQLALLLTSGGNVRFAVVSASSEALALEVKAALAERLGDAFHWHEAVLEEAASAAPLVKWRTLEPDPQRVVAVTGLGRLLTAHPGEWLPILNGFNLQREALAERREGLVFFVDEEGMVELRRQAPDFYRYTLIFRFERILDFYERERSKEEKEAPKEDWSLPLSYYENRVERARKSGRPETVLPALLDLAQQAAWKGQGDLALGTAVEAFELSRVLGELDPLRVRARLTLGWIHLEIGRVNEALGEAQELVQLLMGAPSNEGPLLVSEELGPAAFDLLGKALQLESAASAKLGYAARALELVKLALDRLPTLAEVTMADLVRIGASALVALGRPQEALRFAQERVVALGPTSKRTVTRSAALEVSHLVGDLRQTCEVAGKMIAHLKGEARDSLERFLVAPLFASFGELAAAERLVESGRPSASPFVAAPSLRSLAIIGLTLLRQPAYGEARLVVDAHLTSATAVGALSHWAGASLGSAQVESLGCRWQFALKQAFQVHDRLIEAGCSRFLPDAETLLARLSYLSGNLPEAHRWAESAAEKAREMGARAMADQADTERAFIALAKGDGAEAKRLASGVILSIGETRYRIDEPPAVAARAAALRLLGEDDRPDERRWRRLVRGIGAKGLERRIEQSLEAVGQLVPAEEP